MKKKLLALLTLAILLTFGMATAAWADVIEGKCGENVTYEYEESSKTLIIKGNGPMDDFNPGTAPWFKWQNEYECEKIVYKIKVEDGVTHIGSYAFGSDNPLGRYGWSVKFVELPNSVTSIGEGAFFGDSWLTHINIPPNVDTIGEAALVDVPADSLGWNVIPNTLGTTNTPGDPNSALNRNYTYEHSADHEGVIFNKNKTVLVQYLNAKQDDRYSEENITYEIPDTVTEIGPYAFANCYLNNVEIPASVQKIGKEAFATADRLESIVIPYGVETIESCTFWNCRSDAYGYRSGLLSIAIPNTVKKIDVDAFSDTAPYGKKLQVNYGGTELEWEAIEMSGVTSTNEGYDLLNGDIEYNYYNQLWGPQVPIAGIELQFSGQKITTKVENTTHSVHYNISPSNATNTNVILTSSNPDVVQFDVWGELFGECAFSGYEVKDKPGEYWINYKALAPGETTITVMSAENHEIVDSFTVVVEGGSGSGSGTTNPAVKVTGVELNKTALTLGVKDSETLTAKVAPANATNQKVNWSSNNTSVATVDSNGKVTAVATGTATITATTADGGKTATCTVTVASLTLDKTRLEMIASNQSREIPIKVTVTGITGADVNTAAWLGNNVAWKGNTDNIGVDRSTRCAHATGAGQATITAYLESCPTVKATVTITAKEVEDNKNIYNIAFDANGGVLQGADVIQVTPKTELTMPTATYSGYNLKYWQDKKDETKTYAVGANNAYKFAADTELKAIWERKSSGGGGGGHSNRPAQTETPTKPGTTEKPGTTTTPGTSSGTVTAQNINNTFADVKNGAWYADAIAYVYNKGMMNGTDVGKFEPGATTTRAMLVTMLFRLEGEPAAGAPNFSDVASGQWFSDAIAWASAQGVVNGLEDGKFAPNNAITREQLAVILYRFAQLKGNDVSAKGSLNGFSDSGSVSGWATEAMQWAVGAGIINGDDGALKPDGNATRAEVAVMLMRYLENVK